MTTSPFRELLKYTTPGPQSPCPSCHTYGLRRYRPPTGQEEIICVNIRCPESPLHSKG
jgi:hypothetical protein